MGVERGNGGGVGVEKGQCGEVVQRRWRGCAEKGEGGWSLVV